MGMFHSTYFAYGFQIPDVSPASVDRAACDCEAEVHMGAGFYHHPWCATKRRAELGDVDRLQNKILELEADLATVKDLLRTENKRGNDAIDREETAEQTALEAEQDRAAVLREAAARYEEILAKASPEQDPRYWTAVRDITLGLRRMADEAQRPEETQR